MNIVSKVLKGSYVQAIILYPGISLIVEKMEVFGFATI